MFLYSTESSWESGKIEHFQRQYFLKRFVYVHKNIYSKMETCMSAQACTNTAEFLKN